MQLKERGGYDGIWTNDGLLVMILQLA